MSPDIINYTPEEIKKAAAIVRSFSGGMIPLELYYSIVEAVRVVSFEVLPLRLQHGRVQVLMQQRPEDDPYWPNQWHTPGAMLRANDHNGSYESPLQRIITGELKGVEVNLNTLRRLEDFPRMTNRGPEVVLWHYIEVTNVSDEAYNRGWKWFDIDNLPEDTVNSQVDQIKRFGKSFQAEFDTQIDA